MTAHNTAINSEPETTEHIIRIVRQVMRCVIRLFGRHINMRAFLQIARQVAVEEAYKQAREEQPEGKVTLSRVAMMTGLDTRSIKQVRQEDNHLPERDICPEAALLARWARDPQFRSSAAKPPANPWSSPSTAKWVRFRAW